MMYQLVKKYYNHDSNNDVKVSLHKLYWDSILIRTRKRLRVDLYLPL